MDDVLDPARRRFPRRFRGYDPRSVDDGFAEIDAALAAALADRDAALAQVNDLREALDRARDEIAELRRRLWHNHATGAGGSGQPLAERVQHLLTTAHQQAAAIRAEAERYAQWVRERCQAMLAQREELLEQAEQEAQRRLAEADRQAAAILLRARNDRSSALLNGLRDRGRAGESTTPVEHTVDVTVPVQSVPSGSEIGTAPAEGT